MRIAVWIVALMVALVGCSKQKAIEAYAEPSYGDYSGYDMEADEAPMAKREAKRRSSRSAPARPQAVPPVSSADDAGGAVAPEEPAPERMIAYEGSTTLRVARIRPAVDEITAKVEALGGFVERVDGARMMLRVPVARFREGLAAVQETGDVIDERIFASDVTEAFQDIALRLDTAKATRERLVELLAQTENDQERLALIREIQRLTDQIDQMSAQSTTLRRLADLSRISVVLVEREALAHQGAADSQVFAWIRQISPFGSDVVRAGSYVKLDVPEGMVGLKQWREYAAEAPDGSRIWSGRLNTSLEADSEFWIEAIEERLGEDFASAEVSSLGDFAVLTLTARDDEPYTWVIAVHAHGNKLDVVEAYLSAPEQAERFLPAIRAVIAARGGAA